MATDISPSLVPPPGQVSENAPRFAAEGNGGGGQTDKQPDDTSGGGTKATHAAPRAYVQEALNDAERLLKYAAEIGVEVDSEIRDSVLRAADGSRLGWTEKMVADLLAALTKLAARLKPVTAESLEATNNRREIHPVQRSYWIVSICLVVCILFFSVLSFVTTAISKNIGADIETANDLAVKLRTQLGAPPIAGTSVVDLSQPPAGQNPVEIVTELQQYASAIRAINARSRQLNRFVFSHATESYLEDLQRQPDKGHRAFQLDVGLPNLWKAW